MEERSEAAMDMEIIGSCSKCGEPIYRYFSLYDGRCEECFKCGCRVKLGALFEEKEKLMQSVPTSSP